MKFLFAFIMGTAVGIASAAPVTYSVTGDLTAIYDMEHRTWIYDGVPRRQTVTITADFDQLQGVINSDGISYLAESGCSDLRNGICNSNEPQHGIQFISSATPGHYHPFEFDVAPHVVSAYVKDAASSSSYDSIGITQQVSQTIQTGDYYSGGYARYTSYVYQVALSAVFDKGTIDLTTLDGFDLSKAVLLGARVEQAWYDSECFNFQCTQAPDAAWTNYLFYGDSVSSTPSEPNSPIPEPSTLWLLISSGLAFAHCRRRYFGGLNPQIQQIH